MDERFLCPMLSSTTQHVEAGSQMEVRVQGSFFSIPLSDVLRLPLSNSTVEELSQYFAQRLVAALGAARLQERRIESLTVGIMETPGQEACFTQQVASLAEPAPALAAEQQ